MSKGRPTPWVAISLLTALSVMPPGHAGVVLDGTLGRMGPLSGPNYMIDADLGKQAGGNLFHSFSSFSIGKTESAVFRGPGAVENIISRVTGGGSSTIDGLLKSEIQGANLYFINPSGIMFGPNAKLDVRGSFHATTADYLKLGDSGILFADIVNTSILASAHPSAFGFLDRTGYGKISNHGFLEVPEGKTVSLIGGDITVENGNIFAPAGTVHIISTASAGESVTGPAGYSVDSFGPLGTINVLETRPREERPVRLEVPVGNVDVSGKTGGGILIRAGRFVVDGGYLYADTLAGGNGMGVDIHVAERISMGSGARITAESYGSGDGGMIDITTPFLGMDGKSTVSSLAASSGKAGDVFLAADTLDIRDSYINASTYSAGRGGKVSVCASEKVNIAGYFTDAEGNYMYSAGIYSGTAGTGDGGTISITTPGMTMDNLGAVSTSSIEGSSGKGGDIALNVGTLSLKNGALINLQAQGAGNGGSLIINAAESIVLSGDWTTLSSNVSASGKGGNIGVNAPAVLLENGARIEASATGTGSGGDITLNVGTLEMKSGAQMDAKSGAGGNGGNIAVRASESVLITGQGTELNANSYGSGNTGSFSITSPYVLINDGAVISNDKSYGGSGRAGDIAITAERLVLDTDGYISSSTSGAAEDAGDIMINVGRLSLTNGGHISTNGFWGGRSGAITVNASESSLFSGYSSGLSCYNGGSDPGGGIAIKTPLLIMEDGASIAASTESNGSGGMINIDVGSLILTDGAGISSGNLFGASGSGGHITVKASDSVRISSLFSGISANTSGEGSGGNIHISTPSLTLDEGSISASTSGPGRGGDIVIEVGSLIVKDNGSISSDSWKSMSSDSSAKGGDGGTVTVNASRSILLSGSLWTAALSTETGTSGSGGSINVTTPSLIMEDRAQIAAGSSESGNAGNISLAVGNLTMNSGAQINSRSSRDGRSGTVAIHASGSIHISGDISESNYWTGISCETSGNGAGGSVMIQTPLLQMTDHAQLSVSSFNSGNAGDILLETGMLTLSGGSQIHSAGLGSGDSGSLNITVRDMALMSGGYTNDEGEFYASGLLVGSYGTGKGGRIEFSAGALLIEQKALISSVSTGTGNAGNISVIADMVRSDSAFITTEALNAAGGNIHLWACDVILTRGSAIAASVAAGEGGGGNVSIAANVLVALDDSDIMARADQGFGGNIVIDALSVFTTRDVDFDASSNVTGREGRVEVRSPVTDISSNIVELPAAFLSIDAFLPKPCAEREGEASSLVVRGRDGLPPQPESLVEGL